MFILLAFAGYLISGVLVRRLRRFEIGPKDLEDSKQDASWKEMIEGFHILRSQRDSFHGILATAIQRGGLTSLTMMVLLLERNTYHHSNQPDAGLSGFADNATNSSKFGHCFICARAWDIPLNLCRRVPLVPYTHRRARGAAHT